MRRSKVAMPVEWRAHAIRLETSRAVGVEPTRPLEERLYFELCSRKEITVYAHGHVHIVKKRRNKYAVFCRGSELTRFTELTPAQIVQHLREMQPVLRLIQGGKK